VTVLNLCSFLVSLYSLSMLPPIVIGLVHGEQDVSSFLITFVSALAVGAVGWVATRKSDRTLKARDGFLVAVLFWLVLSGVSATPFLLDKRADLSVVEAVFEGTSGITTTGASVLNNIDDQPKSLLYYRAQLNFLGGLGIIVLAVAVMPLLYQSEMPGPLKGRDWRTPPSTCGSPIWGLRRCAPDPTSWLA
jgi:trk system potassium uptake protein TrkH